MEGLSIEQKAKAYDKALERAKQLYVDGMPQISRNTTAYIFPELKESEDEKIRKFLIEDIKDTLSSEDFRHYNTEHTKKLEEALAWLKKQGEKKSVNKVEPKFKVGDIIRFKGNETLKGEAETHKIVGYDNELYVFADGTTDLFCEQDLYELVEQKSADTIEPKFHEGDWIVNKLGGIWHIDSSDNKNYKVTDINGNHKCFPIDIQDRMRLWTIQDAKDGDVLFQDLMGGKVFIYNGINPDMTILYSFIISNDGEELLSYNIGKPNTGIGTIEDNKNIIYPATKEQRDLLFQKMKEAGYEWSDEIYKLKKIEQKNTEWNEEDEHKVKDTIYFLDTAKKHYASTEELDACIDWLKSLKERIGG